jgi:exosortase/archaeosortase family protein
LTDLTILYVGFLLRLTLPAVTVDGPGRGTKVGSGDFVVEIGNQCCGFEGLGLILVFSLVWLFFLRKEIRFPRSLILIPAGMLAMWLLNGIRIAALIFIGAHGAPQIAMRGFHSQAGWVSFCGVTLGFAAFMRDSPWLRSTASAGLRKICPIVIRLPIIYCLSWKSW